MTHELPEVVKCAERLLLEVELAVRRFTRVNRYGFGAELRAQAFGLASLTHRAWREAPRRSELMDQLAREVDDLNTRLRLGKQLRAFASFAQFELLVRTAESLGRQVGGWRKQQHRKGQNPPPRVAAPERAQTLSARAASAEAKP